MNLSFESVYDEEGKPTTLALAILYSHLEKRTPEQNISHKEMPSWEQHVTFVSAHPHPYWWLVYDRIDLEGEDGPYCEHICVGQAYFTRQREIGITISDEHQRKGYASAIVHKMLEVVPRGPVFANVSPRNIPSQKLFEDLGFGVVQWVYRLDPIFFDEPLYPGHPAARQREEKAAEPVAPQPEHVNGEQSLEN